MPSTTYIAEPVPTAITSYSFINHQECGELGRQITGFLRISRLGVAHQAKPLFSFGFLSSTSAKSVCNRSSWRAQDAKRFAPQRWDSLASGASYAMPRLSPRRFIDLMIRGIITIFLSTLSCREWSFIFWWQPIHPWYQVVFLVMDVLDNPSSRSSSCQELPKCLHS
jgi:hypothetical protein